MNFTISPDTYSIDDLNTKVKVAVLQYKQSWEALEINHLKLTIPKYYTFMVSNSFFCFFFFFGDVIGVPSNHLEKTTRTKSTWPPNTYDT